MAVPRWADGADAAEVPGGRGAREFHGASGEWLRARARPATVLLLKITRYQNLVTLLTRYVTRYRYRYRYFAQILHCICLLNSLMLFLLSDLRVI